MSKFYSKDYYVINNSLSYLGLLFQQALSLHDLLRSITFFISYVLVWVNFILCWFLDSPPLFSGDDRIPTINESEQTCNYDQDEKKEVNDISPEESATFLSRLSFWWLTRCEKLTLSDRIEDCCVHYIGIEKLLSSFDCFGSFFI